MENIYWVWSDRTILKLSVLSLQGFYVWQQLYLSCRPQQVFPYPLPEDRDTACLCHTMFKFLYYQLQLNCSSGFQETGLKKNGEQVWVLLKKCLSGIHTLLKGVNNFYPYFSHLMSDLGEIQYTRSAPNPIVHLWFSLNWGRKGCTCLMSAN